MNVRNVDFSEFCITSSAKVAYCTKYFSPPVLRFTFSLLLSLSPFTFSHFSTPVCVYQFPMLKTLVLLVKLIFVILPHLCIHTHTSGGLFSDVNFHCCAACFYNSYTKICSGKLLTAISRIYAGEGDCV